MAVRSAEFSFSPFVTKSFCTLKVTDEIAKETRVEEGSLMHLQRKGFQWVMLTYTHKTVKHWGCWFKFPCRLLSVVSPVLSSLHNCFSISGHLTKLNVRNEIPSRAVNGWHLKVECGGLKTHLHLALECSCLWPGILRKCGPSVSRSLSLSSRKSLNFGFSIIF